MSDFKNIEKKLQQFIRKYYRSELIKGCILFISLGFLYFFFVLFLESFLWLKPTARTILFWLFILVELLLLIFFIAVPFFKLVGFRKGITYKASSKIIGNHFPEVQDKLLNILQLKESKNQSDLLLASIDQKSKELQPIPFVKAIDFKQNKKYLKYMLIPFLMWIISSLSDNNNNLKQSLERVVNHQRAYLPPAPFSFLITNTNLKVIQGKSISVTFKVVGKIMPEEVKIYFDNKSYYLQKKELNTFSYTFSNVQKPINFYVKANEIESQQYKIDLIKTPTINTLSLQVNYPRYINKKNEIVKNSGNIIVPEGTNITWKVQTNQTDSIAFINDKERYFFNPITKNLFTYSKRIRKNLDYKITSSNKNLRDFEILQFSIGVIKDEKPTISVHSNIDSITRENALFVGQISDDYGLNKLQLVYYKENDATHQNVFNLPITKENIQTFSYQFPNGLSLEKGVNYEFFFEVFDNDAVNGSKKAKSKVYNIRKKTDEEVNQETLQEQKNAINNIESTIFKQQQEQKKLESFQKELQNKKNIRWKDQKKIEELVRRQNQYNKMMQRQTDKLHENLEEKKEENKSLQTKKEDLKKRLNELKKLQKQQKLLDEIQKMAKKINKEDLLKKAKKLAQQNKQQERSLERVLELTKRFYVEQKTMQIANKIENLSKKQEKTAKEDNTAQPQEKIQKEFEEIKKQLEELQKDNQKLKQPMELPDVEDEKEATDTELKKAEENLLKDHKSETKKHQKNASKKMKEMSAKMKQSMESMESESMEENMDDLRKILDNLLVFSFEQEDLITLFDDTSASHPNFGKNLKKQHQLKTYFEHIDDSLYVLSMRLPKISAKITTDLSSIHYNLNQSLENFSENRFSNGISNQRYVMTSVNNLADYLSNTLNNMKNAMSMQMKKGKGKGKGFSLPDLIKKQEGLSKKMQKGMQKGKGKGKKPGEKGEGEGKGKGQGEGQGEGEGKGQGQGQGKGEGQGEGKEKGNSNEDLDGEIYKIYKEQSLLRQALQQQIKQSRETGNNKAGSGAKKALKEMIDLENEILEKGFNANTLQKMKNLNYELLKLEKAALEQGKDKKRKSTSNTKNFTERNIKTLRLKKQFFNQVEILNRQSLPLQQNYKKKVQAYFSETKNK